MSEEELAKAVEGLGMDEGDGEGNILPIMQSIMQNLLSKDVLYPSLREITEKVCPRFRPAPARGPVCRPLSRSGRTAVREVGGEPLGRSLWPALVSRRLSGLRDPFLRFQR